MWRIPGALQARAWAIDLGEAGGVIGAKVDELPAGAAGLVGVPAGQPVPGAPLDPHQHLDVDVNQGTAESTISQARGAKSGAGQHPLRSGGGGARGPATP